MFLEKRVKRIIEKHPYTKDPEISAWIERILSDIAVEIEEDYYRKSEHLATKDDIKEVIEFTKNEIKHVIELMNARFEAIEKHFEAVEKRFEAIDKRFEDMNKRFEDIQHQMNRQTNFMIIGFTIISILITILTLFHNTK